jgi:hypothetical protein
VSKSRLAIRFVLKLYSSSSLLTPIPHSLRNDAAPLPTAPAPAGIVTVSFDTGKTRYPRPGGRTLQVHASLSSLSECHIHTALLQTSHWQWLTPASVAIDSDRSVSRYPSRSKLSLRRVLLYYSEGAQPDGQSWTRGDLDADC